MIIDSHFHLDEEMLPLDKMIKSMDQNGINKTVLISKIIPPIYGPLTAKEEKLSTLFRQLILRCNPWGKLIYRSLLEGDNWRVLNNYLKIVMAPDNGPIIEAIKQYPDRLMGWITVNPIIPGDVVQEVDRLQCLPNMIGVKVLPYYHGYNIERLEKLAAYCQERNLPMLLHLSAQSECYRYLPENFPKLKIIYAHAGLPHWRKLWRAMDGYKNVYIDLSAFDYVNREIAEVAIKAVGYQKCLYGTDGPYGMPQGGSFDYSKVKGMIEQLPLSDYQKEAILGDTLNSLIS